MIADPQPQPPGATAYPVGPVERGYYSITEAATLLGVSRMSIWRWIRAGRLPVARLGQRTTRIRREDLERLLADRVPATAHLRMLPDGASEPAVGDGTDERHAPVRGWQQVGSTEHVVQVYEADACLLEAVGEYIGAALRAGETGIVIATAAHREGLEARLLAAGLDLEAARAGGRYVALDAAETLGRFMVDGEPEPGRFAEVVGSLVARAAEGGRPVRAFGEMVALLAGEGNHAAAIRLEALWNGLQRVHPFALFCAYPMDVLGGERLAGVFGDLSGEHTRVVPAESYTMLEDPDTRLREIARLQHKAASLEAEVAQRTRLEAELHRRERELRDFVENATEGLHWVGPDGRILWANRAELELLGYTREEYVGRHIAEFHADPEVIADILSRLAAGEELHGYEARMRARDGSIKHVLINSNVLREDGRFVHTRCFTRDITERKQMEDALRLSEERFRATFDQAAVAMSVIDLDGRWISFNAAYPRMFGYETEELRRLDFTRLTHPDDRAADREGFRRLLAGEISAYAREKRYVRKDGALVWGAVHVAAVRDQAGAARCMVAVVQDITERKRAEEAALRLAAIVESSNDAIIGKTLEGIITDWNRGAQRIYGYTAAEVLGRPISLLIPEDRPDELPSIMGRLRRGQRIDHYETERVTKDGRRISVSVTISPIRDSSGHLVGASAIARDISERRALERLQHDFLAMVSHELRNPLATVKGLAQLTQRRGAYNERAIQGIVAQANHLDRLVGDLLDVARLEAGRLELHREPLDLVMLVADNVEQAQAQTEAHCLRLETPASPLLGSYDRDRLNQVIQNLLGNAIKYAPGGEVMVRVAAEGPEARISVSDEGPGIPPEDAPKLFERFYRSASTADGAKGFGIGLYVARTLVEAHGGRIWVEPRSGPGCEFAFSLPLGTGGAAHDGRSA